MDAKKRLISKNFKKYEIAKKDEFFLKNGVRADALLFTKRDLKKVHNKSYQFKIPPSELNPSTEDAVASFKIIDDELLEKFSPNNIDSGYFWKKAIQTFPLASVVYNPKCKNKTEINDVSLNEIHGATGAIKILDEILNANPDAKMLEIGPGYGSVTNHIVLNHNLNNYYAIDVNPLFKLKHLYKTDGKTIPEQVPYDLSVVYSINVFQHLSPEQRLSYYKQIKERLVPHGKFIFSMFVVHEKNEGLVMKSEEEGEYARLFGTVDSRNNYYTNFFNQFTRCDRLSELVKIFCDLKMDLKFFHSHFNHLCMIATKL